MGRMSALLPSRSAALLCSALVCASVSAPVLLTATDASAQTKAAPGKGDPSKDDGKKEGEEKKEEGESNGQPGQTAPADAAKKDEKPADDEKKEEFSDQVESKKAIFFSGEIGFTRPDLGAISNNLGFDRTAANGVLYGLATGLRLGDLRIGGRWRVYDTTEYSLWSLGGSIGYGLPIRPLTPILTAHVGYVFDQNVQPGAIRSSLPQGSFIEPDVDLNGLLLGLDLNASYWITKFLRMGAFVGADLMFLHRSQADVPRSIFGNVPIESQSPLFTDSGSGTAFVFNLGLRGAFDIGF